MKKIVSYISATVLCAALIAGCAKDAPEGKQGEGALSFTVGWKAQTRADAPANCVVKVATADGKIVYEYNDLADIPAKLWLTSGDYIVVAEGGTKAVSGWDAPFYKGSESFTISAGQTTNVEVECLLQNALFTVAFDESVTVPMSGYSVTLSPAADDDSHDLVFDETNPGAVGYVLPSAGVTQVGWAFTAEHESYGTVVKNGTITVEPRKKYELTFKHTPFTGDFDLDFTITVIEEPIDEIVNNIPIFQRPKLTGVGFDLSQTQLPADQYEIAATAAADLASIVLTGSVFGAGGIDLLSDDLTGTGVYTLSTEGTAVSIFLTSELFARMSGLNEITITVTDVNGKTNSAVFRIETSGIEPVSGPRNIWATFANVSAKVLEDGTNNVRFAYRPAGGDAWEYVSGTEGAAGKYTAQLIGLDPSTAYEAALEVNGQLKNGVAAFTTDAALQFPNSGFEEYGVDGSLHYFYSNKANQFWDSGNKGSTTLGESITQSYAGGRPGSAGSRCVQLKSKWVGVNIGIKIGAFAAASIYSGLFVDTDDMGGIVDFGRPFTSRPSALTVWYKATAGTVDYKEKSGAPIGVGDKDKYQIFVVLADWGTVRRINTNNQSTFIDYAADPGIIAYGSKESSDNVSDWTPATVKLKYRSLDRTPTHVIVVASASMYGDYFTGSTSSVMYVDDFELIYDENIVLQD